LKEESILDKSEINRVNSKFKQIIFLVRKESIHMKTKFKKYQLF